MDWFMRKSSGKSFARATPGREEWPRSAGGSEQRICEVASDRRDCLGALFVLPHDSREPRGLTVQAKPTGDTGTAHFNGERSPLSATSSSMISLSASARPPLKRLEFLEEAFDKLVQDIEHGFAELERRTSMRVDEEIAERQKTVQPGNSKLTERIMDIEALTEQTTRHLEDLRREMASRATTASLDHYVDMHSSVVASIERRIAHGDQRIDQLEAELKRREKHDMGIVQVVAYLEEVQRRSEEVAQLIHDMTAIGHPLHQVELRVQQLELKMKAFGEKPIRESNPKGSTGEALGRIGFPNATTLPQIEGVSNSTESTVSNGKTRP